MRLKTPAHLTPKKVRCGPSLHHGTGLFTEEAICKGDFVVSYEGYKTRGDKSPYILYCELENGKYLKIMGTGPAKYINHAADPNLTLGYDDDWFNFYALRNILPGEELTWHYGEEFQEWLEEEALKKVEESS